jgi:hypothetical protein
MQLYRIGEKRVLFLRVSSNRPLLGIGKMKDAYMIRLCVGVMEVAFGFLLCGDDGLILSLFSRKSHEYFIYEALVVFTCGQLS